MKITGVRTIRLPEHPQMLWLQVLTDEDITGLGETCLGPATVEAHLHETVAPYLIGQDPGRIAAHRRSLYDVFVGYEGTGAETRGNSAADVALWDIAGQAAGLPVTDLLGGRTRDSIRIYNTCAGSRYGRGNQGALMASDRATAVLVSVMSGNLSPFRKAALSMLWRVPALSSSETGSEKSGPSAMRMIESSMTKSATAAFKANEALTGSPEYRTQPATPWV